MGINKEEVEGKGPLACLHNMVEVDIIIALVVEDIRAFEVDNKIIIKVGLTRIAQSQAMALVGKIKLLLIVRLQFRRGTFDKACLKFGFNSNFTNVLLIATSSNSLVSIIQLRGS